MGSERNQAVAFFDGFDELAETDDYEAVREGLLRAYSASTGRGDAHREFEAGFGRQLGQLRPRPRLVGGEPVGDDNPVVVEEYAPDTVAGPDGCSGEFQGPFRRSRCEGSALNEQVESQAAAEAYRDRWTITARRFWALASSLVPSAAGRSSPKLTTSIRDSAMP